RLSPISASPQALTLTWSEPSRYKSIPAVPILIQAREFSPAHRLPPSHRRSPSLLLALPTASSSLGTPSPEPSIASSAKLTYLSRPGLISAEASPPALRPHPGLILPWQLFQAGSIASQVLNTNGRGS